MTVKEDSCDKITSLNFSIPEGIEAFYVELSLTKDSKIWKNVYYFSAAEGYVFKNVDKVWTKAMELIKGIPRMIEESE